MSYLLDTSICILLIRQKPPQLLAKLTSHGISDIYVSSLTVAELHYGVQRSTRPTQNQHALDQFLLPFTILPFDEGAAAHYGRIRAHLEVQGTPIGALDTLIAAQGLQHSLIAVTNNVREFSRVPGLAIEDWTEPPTAG